MTIREELSAALEDLEDALDADTFEYRGATFYFIPGTDSEAMTLAPGGFQEDIDKVIIVRRDQMPIKTADDAIRTVDDALTLADSDNLPPHIHKKLRIAQIDYRIVSKRLNSSGASWTLGLGSKDR